MVKAIQTDAQGLRVAVLVILIAIIPQPIQEMAVRVLLVVPHALHTVKILPIIQAVALDRHVVLPVVPYVRILPIILLADAQDLHVPVSVRENVPLLVLKHVPATVLENVAMDARATAGAAVRIHAQEAVDDNAAYRAVVLAVVNAPLAAPHSVSTLPKVVAVEAAQEVAA